MKIKVLLIFTIFFWFISTTNAALDIITTPISDNQVKVEVVSDSTDKVNSVWFTLWYDPTLQVKSLSNWNLFVNGKPTLNEGTIWFFGEGSNSDIGSWVVTSFILERPSNSNITSSVVALESASINGIDIPENDLLTTSKNFTYWTISSDTPDTIDSTITIQDNTKKKKVSVSKFSTSTKTGAEENAIIIVWLLTLLLGSLYIKRIKNI